MRRIIHVDMDAFYAAIEQRDDPRLRGRPIAVGSPSGRGVVMTASYEARPSGVHSAMPSAEARRRCPELVFVPPRMDVYKKEARRIRRIFAAYTDLVEPRSLDEAYLDVTVPKQGPPSGTILARRILREIRAATGLTASAGVSHTKFVAKVASDWKKPDGLTVVPPAEAHSFIARLPIERFHGIGPVTARQMRALGIRTGDDLQAWDEADLVTRFGRRGRFFYRIAHAQDARPVRPERTRKSVGAERTFRFDLTARSSMLAALRKLACRVAGRLRRAEAQGRRVTLKIKYADFTVRTRSTTGHRALCTARELAAVAAQLLHTPALPKQPVRLLGITVGKLQVAGKGCGYQLTLPFDAPVYGDMPPHVSPAPPAVGDESNS